MSEIFKALGWAAAIISVAIASRAGLIGGDIPEWLMMAMLVGWVATSTRGNCRSCSISRN